MLTGKRILSSISVLVASTKYSIQKLKICSSAVYSIASFFFLNLLINKMFPTVEFKYLHKNKNKYFITFAYVRLVIKLHFHKINTSYIHTNAKKY